MPKGLLKAQTRHHTILVPCHCYVPYMYMQDEHFTKMADIEKRVHMLEKSVAKVKDMEEETRGMYYYQ